MSNVVRIDFNRQATNQSTAARAPSPYEEFGLARRAMFQAYLAWLRTAPSTDDVRAEIAGTVSALDQMHLLGVRDAR